MTTDSNNKLSKNVILVDAEYIDKVASDLIVNFERILKRRIPEADLAHWLDCIALDGGLKPQQNDIQVIFIYNKKNTTLKNFSPSNLTNEIHLKAFTDNLGEFSMYAYPVETNITTKEFFFLDTLTVILDDQNVENVMIISDIENYGAKVREQLDKSKDNGKNTTLFAMTPQEGNGFKQEILGYSLMSALGINSNEL